MFGFFRRTAEFVVNGLDLLRPYTPALRDRTNAYYMFVSFHRAEFVVNGPDLTVASAQLVTLMVDTGPDGDGCTAI